MFGEVVRRPGRQNDRWCVQAKSNHRRCIIKSTLCLIKVYIDFAGRALDVDYLNMVGEFQQSKAGSQSSVDCSRECRVQNGAGLRILEQLLLLLFNGSDGAVGTQHISQRVG